MVNDIFITHRNGDLHNCASSISQENKGGDKINEDPRREMVTFTGK